MLVLHSDDAILILSSTVGAGDAFIAGILHEDWDLPRKASFANELAGRKVVQEGFSGLGNHIQHAL